MKSGWTRNKVTSLFRVQPDFMVLSLVSVYLQINILCHADEKEGFRGRTAGSLTVQNEGRVKDGTSREKYFSFLQQRWNKWNPVYVGSSYVHMHLRLEG